MHTTTIIVRQAPAEVAGVRAAAQDARNAAEQARDIARAERDAAQAQRDAAQALRDAQQAGSEGGNIGVVTITKDGQTVVLNNASPEAVATALGIPIQDQPPESDGPYVVAGLGIVSTAVVVLVSVVMRYRAKMRGTGPSGAMQSELSQRMARMENAIESVAVEVERISEGQRFTTRLLSDRAPQEVPRG
ncbi:MAG: hypothetical protein U5K74_08450 [Gemmatimonadaceae bacterium]|nr:hypothetical protein [Gemmatimonadaceae bacterium]